MQGHPVWVYDDGGRAAAGYKGEAGDCVVRAIAIAAQQPYSDMYTRLAGLMTEHGYPRSARNGVDPKLYGAVLAELGFEWTATMPIGSGCQVHLRPDELPAGRLVVRLSRHIAAVVDGVVHDTYDCTRGGTRCVYGYWRAP